MYLSTGAVGDSTFLSNYNERRKFRIKQRHRNEE